MKTKLVTVENAKTLNKQIHCTRGSDHAWVKGFSPLNARSKHVWVGKCQNLPSLSLYIWNWQVRIDRICTLRVLLFNLFAKLPPTKIIQPAKKNEKGGNNIFSFLPQFIFPTYFKGCNLILYGSCRIFHTMLLCEVGLDWAR